MGLVREPVVWWLVQLLCIGVAIPTGAWNLAFRTSCHIPAVICSEKHFDNQETVSHSRTFLHFPGLTVILLLLLFVVCLFFPLPFSQ